MLEGLQELSAAVLVLLAHERRLRRLERLLGGLRSLSGAASSAARAIADIPNDAPMDDDDRQLHRRSPRNARSSSDDDYEETEGAG